MRLPSLFILYSTFFPSLALTFNCFLSLPDPGTNLSAISQLLPLTTSNPSFLTSDISAVEFELDF